MKAGLGEKLEEFVALARAGAARWSTDAEVVSAFEQSPHCTLLADSASLRIVGFNEAMRRTLGFAAKDLLQLSLADVFSRAGEGDSFLNQLRSPDPKVPLRAQQRASNGRLADVEIVGYRVDARRRPLLAFMTQDITLRTRFEARLLEKQGHLDHLAHHDPLTGLPNRLYLSAQLPNAIEAARRAGKTLAIFCLDLDRFKHINDSRGHEVGDLLLTAVAQRLRQVVRDEDMVVRMGGDEFIVVLREPPDQQHIDDTAIRVMEVLAQPFDIGGRSVAVTVSIGMSQYPHDGVDMGALLRHSDTAMYEAKQCGRNNCQRFNPQMDRRVKQRAYIEAQLREALLTGQLDVHYQPIVDLVSQRVVALESLLRLEASDSRFHCAGSLYRHCRGDRADCSHRRIRAAESFARCRPLAQQRGHTGTAFHQRLRDPVTALQLSPVVESEYPGVWIRAESAANRADGKECSVRTP